MPKKFQVIFSGVVLSLSALLNSCGNSEQLEGFLGADPSLQSKTDKTATNNSSNAIAAERENLQLTKSPKENSTTNSELQSNEPNGANSLTTETESEQSFADLPESLPFYPQATLEVIAPDSSLEEGVSEWRSQDSVDTIVNYYQEKWQTEDWQVVRSFQTDAENQLTAIVNRDNLDYTILLTPTERQEATQLTISYRVTESPNSADTENTEGQIATNSDNLEDNSPNTVDSEETEVNRSQQSFSDLEETPEPLRQYVADLTDLGILTPKTKDVSANSRQFKPNEIITRREYAKWLVNANNRYYDNAPGNKISLATKSNKAAFKDISVNDPDFAEIQGLAEAGLIPSPLTNDSSNLLFKPDAPLTREDLITWKVPLDVRQGLPEADVSGIKEAWGFQDASNINPLALRALFADYQNSDRSNVKRIFGYTTLFQPKKAVTRAEAAASLWHFGYQGDGVTAKETLEVIKP